MKACEEALDSADTALKKADSLLLAKQKIMELRKQQIDQLTKDLAHAQSEEDALFKNPYIWGLIGLVVGGVTIGFTLKK